MFREIEKTNRLEFYTLGKVLFLKENIQDILEYLINVLYNLSLKNRNYLKGITVIHNTINKINSNGNFDMSIDDMLFKVWEEINENNSWS